MNVIKIQTELNELGYGPIKLYPNYGPQTKAAIREFQYNNHLKVDGIAGPLTLAKLFPLDIDVNFITVSQRSIDLIIGYEITSKSYYDAHYQNPEYPGIGSGITVGIGYDLGYNSTKQIIEDWTDIVLDSTLQKMLSVQGLTGQKAKEKLSSVKDITITFDQANTVFLQSDLPKSATQALKIYPTLSELFPDAVGAIISLVFNRGNSLVGGTRFEMKQLQSLILNKDYQGMANVVRSMKRLWDGISDDGREQRVKGLLDRRDSEASLIEKSNRQYLNKELIKIYI